MGEHKKVKEMPSGTAAPEVIGQEPPAQPHCPQCGADLGTAGVGVLGQDPSAANGGIRCVWIYCGNKECSSLLAILPHIATAGMRMPMPPMKGSGLVGATHVPPVPAFMDPTKKRGV